MYGVPRDVSEHVYMYMCMNVYVCLCAYMYMCVCVYMYEHVCICNEYMSTCVCTCIHPLDTGYLLRVFQMSCFIDSK